MGQPMYPNAAKSSPYAPTHTRWDEMKARNPCSSVSRGTICLLTVGASHLARSIRAFPPIPPQRYLATILDFATALSPQGCDVHFLNRPPMRGVTDARQLAPALAAPPAGVTPLVPALQFIWNENAPAISETGMLLIVATDGSPTNAAGDDDLPAFFATVRGKPTRCAMTIIAFTTDRASVEYLDKLVGACPLSGRTGARAAGASPCFVRLFYSCLCPPRAPSHAHPQRAGTASRS